MSKKKNFRKEFEQIDPMNYKRWVKHHREYDVEVRLKCARRKYAPISNGWKIVVTIYSCFIDIPSSKFAELEECVAKVAQTGWYSVAIEKYRKEPVLLIIDLYYSDNELFSSCTSFRSAAPVFELAHQIDEALKEKIESLINNNGGIQ